MQNITKKIVSLVMSVVIITGAVAFTASAAKSASQLQTEINKLEQQSKDLESKIKSYSNEISKQSELKSAYEQKIANTQKQIDLCNAEMSKINSRIAVNKAEIKKNNDKIEADKDEFKKRIRAIYMSNSGSNVQVLLGADNFSDYLQLSQMTSSVSAHDKAMIEKIVEAVKVLEEKQAENNKLLQEQVSIKETVNAKQRELQSESSKISSIISSISSDKSQATSDNNSVEKQIKERQSDLAELLRPAYSSSDVYDGSDFKWPVPSSGRISCYFSSYHHGVDIASGFGTPIVAIADGTVIKLDNSHTDNYGKGSGYTGNSYGNYITINHGTLNGKNYTATYAHLTRASVSLGQKVTKGQVIGTMGSTGYSTGSHLHFGIAVNGSWVNPMGFYSKVK